MVFILLKFEKLLLSVTPISSQIKWESVQLGDTGEMDRKEGREVNRSVGSSEK